MRKTSFATILLFVYFLSSPGSLLGQKGEARSPRIVNAKTVYFQNQTRSDRVGREALAQLKKWDRFTIVDDPKKADLIFLLTESPRANVLFADGQTGTISGGQITREPVPNYIKSEPVSGVYLSVIEQASGEMIWSDVHRSGCLMTGFNSAGARLMKELQKLTKK